MLAVHVMEIQAKVMGRGGTLVWWHTDRESCETLTVCRFCTLARAKLIDLFSQNYWPENLILLSHPVKGGP